MLKPLLFTQSPLQGKKAQSQREHYHVQGQTSQKQKKQSKMCQLWRSYPQQGQMSRLSCFHPPIWKGKHDLKKINYLQSAR